MKEVAESRNGCKARRGYPSRYSKQQWHWIKTSTRYDAQRTQSRWRNEDRIEVGGDRMRKMQSKRGQMRSDAMNQHATKGRTSRLVLADQGGAKRSSDGVAVVLTLG